MVNVSTHRPVAQYVTSMKNYVANDLKINSSYSAIYGQYFKIYDSYNEVNRWVPVTGYVGATIARVDFNTAQWYAPAGLNRGIIDGILDVAVTPDKAQRDVMYVNRINPIINFTGQGIVIWGQKTLQARPSAFDRINVRRLFLHMERSIEKLARYFLFEINDEITRSRFRGLVNGFLSDIKVRRGVTDFLVVCDTSNNPPDVVDRNEFVAEILVKPSRAIEFIKLVFTAVNTGVSFSEVVGK
jgi:phage tail sheath protein FI